MKIVPAFAAVLVRAEPINRVEKSKAPVRIVSV